jgi:glycerophosphoryl diester phosphodiesterase
VPFYDNFKNKKNLIAAHRGFQANRPENTMSAFKESLDKCDFIELDVSFSKDNVAVVIHDNSCERTSDIIDFIEYKDRFNVCDLNYDELLKLDFGSWFIDKDPYNTIKNSVIRKSEITKQKIPTVKEVLSFCKENNMPVNLEIKDLSKTKFHKTAVKNVIQIILNEQMQDLTLISSFNHTYLKEVKKIAPFIQTAALKKKTHPKNLVNYLKELNVVAYNCDDEIINEEIINILKKENIYVNVYTVNDQNRKKQLFELGVNSIFTDCL